MKKLLIACLIVLLAGCSGTTIRPTWAELFGPGEGSADRVPVLLGVKTMPYDELEALCGEMEALRGCATEVWVFLRGEPSESTMLFTVQFVPSYATLSAECGFIKSACYKNNTLYTLAYSTASDHKMGIIGDLINDAWNLDLGSNNRVYLGQLFMRVIVG